MSNDKLTEHYIEILRIKDKRDDTNKKRIALLNTAKELLGQEQELSRKFNKLVEKGRIIVGNNINNRG